MYTAMADLTMRVTLTHQKTNVTTTRYMTYLDNTVPLTDAQQEEILADIDPKYNHPAEKLRNFVAVVYDGSSEYSVELEKTFYDFRTKSEVTRTSVRQIDSEEGLNLFNFFKEKYSKFLLQNFDNLYNTIYEKVSGQSVVKSKLVYIRDGFLDESDKYMLPDFPISDEEREKWRVYRQELRDMTEQQAWKDGLLNQVDMPVAPLPMTQLGLIENVIDATSPTFTKYLRDNFNFTQVEDIIKNLSKVSVKLNIIASLAELKIPSLFHVDLTPLESHELVTGMRVDVTQFSEIFGETDQETGEWEATKPWDDAVANLNAKIEEINQLLNNYELDFTIDELIVDILEEQQRYNDAEALVDSISEG